MQAYRKKHKQTEIACHQVTSDINTEQHVHLVLHGSYAVPRLTVRIEPKHSSATMLASALELSCSEVYFRLTMAKVRNASSRTGRMASVSPVRMAEVMNISTKPKMATTMLLSAELILDVPALFISLVSCMQFHTRALPGTHFTCKVCNFL